MQKPTFKEESLKYHIEGKPGKLEVRATTPLETQADLSMAYSPGVAHACEYIVEDPLNASKVTARGNLVAVISNGTAVLGLGAIGALASKPVMEGKAVLFKRFADIDSIDLEIESSDPNEIINSIKNFSFKHKRQSPVIGLYPLALARIFHLTSKSNLLGHGS